MRWYVTPQVVILWSREKKMTTCTFTCTHIYSRQGSRSTIHLVLTQCLNWPPRWPRPPIYSGSEWCLSMDFPPYSKTPQEICADISLVREESCVTLLITCPRPNQEQHNTIRLIKYTKDWAFSFSVKLTTTETILSHVDSDWLKVLNGF